MNEQEIKKVFENVSIQDMEGLLKHLNDQKAEMAALAGKNNEEMVKFYLDYKAKTSPELAAKYPNNPKGKTIKGCINYITEQAKKVKLGNCAMIHHSIVFEWAEKFFTDDTIEESKPATTTKAKAEAKPRLTKSEMQAKIDKWTNEQAAKIKEWNDKHEAQIDEWNNKHPLDLFGQREPNPHENDKNPYVDEKCPYDIKDAAPDNNEDTPSTEPDKSEPAEEEPINDELIPDDDPDNEEEYKTDEEGNLIF